MAIHMATYTNNTNLKPKRQLSLRRVMLALLILIGSTYLGLLGWQKWKDAKAATVIDPWFAPYVDVVATPRFDFEQLGATPVKNLVLSFIVADPDNPCIPTWGGFYTLDEAGVELDLDRRIARYRQQGGDVAVSFGGLLNNEPALVCQDHEKLLNAYLSVVDRYEVEMIDFDLEGDGLTNKTALAVRAAVVAELQQKRRDAGKNLAVWLTLPVAPQGLTQDGTDAVAQTLSRGVDLTGVNILTMDYGQSRDRNQTMQQASEAALIETHRQLGILYHQADIYLSETSLWSKLGITPMIGQNDIIDEIFTLEDASGLNTFAVSKKIVRMSMWSANRDIQCGENYVHLKVVSDSCSGVKQEELAYVNALSVGFDGQLGHTANLTTTADSEPVVVQDDPAKSPYQIWSATDTYLQNTKIVWHGNVYQAKWWTHGDLPDNPVLQAWETPWQLIGPVLPGDAPIPQPTLPEGTYPNWSGLTVYEAGERILFKGIPYQAKWWTQGDSPAASSSNPDGSPWVILTKQQLDQ